MRLYRLEVWDDWSDGRPEWVLSKWDDEVWVHRENAEKAVVGHAVKELERREQAREKTRASQTEMRAEYVTLVEAGLDPKKFGRAPVAVQPPFDWDDPVDTTLTDEAIGYRVVEVETVD